MTPLFNSLLQRACTVSLTVVPAVAVVERATMDPERVILSGLEVSELEAQRAGHSASIGLDEAELAELRALESQDEGLADQRAGDISNRDLTTVFLILGIIAALVIIL